MEASITERFKACVQADVERLRKEYPFPGPTITGAAVIAARHFSAGESLDVRRKLVSIAAEETGTPMEQVATAKGLVWAWRPARGEVGWPPDDPEPHEWAAHDCREFLKRQTPEQRKAALDMLLADTRFMTER
jgi:hypothetical protein